jgi:hypothetical protein
VAPTPTQLAWRERIEAGLRVAEPFLNVVLAAGDGISRWAGRNQPDTYVPARRLDAEPARPRVGTAPEGE